MKQKKSVVTERRMRIKNLFAEQQILQVSQISELLGISQLTARRDFDALAQEGFIERIHGGGLLRTDHPDNFSKPQHFKDKHQIGQRQKQEIAAYVASLVHDGDTVFLNAGSTTLEVIRRIRQKSVVIVTNNALASTIMGECSASLISTGGEYNPDNQSYTGLMAVTPLQRMNATTCILGVNGITCDEGITTSNYMETMINEEMLKRCRSSHIIAADGSKVGRIFKFSSSPIASVDILVTDSSADPQELKKIQAMGVKVILADKQIFRNP
ncbi:MAG: DeoR/GlpR transcriptional regulator [Lachnospiraceae bacterium]|jgi:DeoR family fructose operon transcriptional repressor|nr:DeoR/GlpR transcriptional regulator [Lachnospiraceae bacterium]